MKVLDEYTFEMKEVDVQNSNEEEDLKLRNKLETALGCDPMELSKKYIEYKNAEKAFKEIYEPAKTNLLKLYEEDQSIPKTIIAGDTKLTYVSPSIKSSIDTKKLKEERPDIAKEFTKTTSVDATFRLTEVIASYSPDK